MMDYIKKTLWEKMIEWDIAAGKTQEEILQTIPQGQTLHCFGPYVSCNDGVSGALHKWELYVNDRKTKSSYFINAQTPVDNAEVVLKAGDKLSIRVFNNNGADIIHFEAWMRGYMAEK